MTMDSCLDSSRVKLSLTLLLFCFICGSVSTTKPPKEAYESVSDKNSSLSAGVNGSIVTDVVSKFDHAVKGTVVVDSAQKNITNGTIPDNSDNSSGLDKGASLNLAIIPVLAIFFVLIFVCIKCCNRVKKDVEKDKDYVEDGKPLFRVEPESHPDYLSSIGSAYNPYSTVTSAYNPYNTVTTMMSSVSTASETRDAGTMVKPRDIWKTMRLHRGSSVPDLEELARERDLIDNIAEEVKRLKSKSYIPRVNNASGNSSHRGNTSGRSRSGMKVRKPLKPLKLDNNTLSVSDHNELNRHHHHHHHHGHHRQGITKADVQRCSESVQTSTVDQIPEECHASLGEQNDEEREKLLLADSGNQSEKATPILLVNGETSTEDDRHLFPMLATDLVSGQKPTANVEGGPSTPPSGLVKGEESTVDDVRRFSSTSKDQPRSPVPTTLLNGETPTKADGPLSRRSSDGSANDGIQRNGSSSRLRSSGKSKSLSVSFQDGEHSPKRNSPRSRSPVSPSSKTSPPKTVEIIRKPTYSSSNPLRKFSLSKVSDQNCVDNSGLSVVKAAGVCINDVPENRATKSSKTSSVPAEQISLPSTTRSGDRSPSPDKKGKSSKIGMSDNGLAVTNGTPPLPVPSLSCH